MKTLGIKREKPTAVPASGLSKKSNRGDRTAIELFLAGVRGWEAGLCRVIVGLSGGKRP